MSRPLRVDPALKQYATTRQAEIIDAVIETGSVRGASRKLGIQFSYISRAVKAAQRNAAFAGYAPDHDLTHPVAPPFIVKGTSTLYGEDGQLKAQWVKTKLDDNQSLQLVKEWIESLTDEVRGKSPRIAPPARTSSDLLAAYPYGDPHFGLYAWGEETGDDFDLNIADSVMCGAIDRLIACAPETDTALVIFLGDTFHANDQSNLTPGHRHQLDVDSRYPKVILAGIKAARHIILRALTKHRRVVVRAEPGNHDPQAVWALVFALAAYFENDDRVIIDLSPSKFWYYSFGKVLIGTTHGDTVKHETLPGVMAADRPMEWGAAKHRYWYTGHVHHQAVREFAGVTCESFRSLVGKDAYAAGHGYRSGRDLYCIVHHKDHGEIERHRCDIGMLK